MPTLKPRQISQLLVMETPEVVGMVHAWATKTGTGKSELLRQAFFGGGWAKVERGLVAEHGRLSQTDLRYGILAALPIGKREAYARQHGLSWTDERCTVPQPGTEAPRPPRKRNARTGATSAVA